MDVPNCWGVVATGYPVIGHQSGVMTYWWKARGKHQVFAGTYNMGL